MTRHLLSSVVVITGGLLLCLLARSAPVSYSAKSSAAVNVRTDIDAVHVEYLRNYGYLIDFLPPQVRKGAAHVSENVRLTPEKIVEAVSRLQAYANLNVTGVLDESTLRLIRTPRCGVNDLDTEVSTKVRKKRIRRSVYVRKWDDIKHITWRWDLHESADLYRLSHYSVPYVLSDLQKAFATWSNGTAARFSRVDDDGESDIRISFARKDHGCGHSFDGTGGVLAHAFYPNGADNGYGGDIHFDSDEIWLAGEQSRYSYNRNSCTSFFHVALHEIGHAIGLTHTNNPFSVMFPWYNTALVNAMAPKLPVADMLTVYELYTEQYAYRQSAVGGTTGEVNPTNQNACIDVYGPYDDITYIEDEMFVLKNGSLWRWYGGRLVVTGHERLSDYFRELPTDTSIDAFHYDNFYKSVIIITGGNELFEYKINGSSHTALIRRVSLLSDVRVFLDGPVDTVFKWRASEVYMFTGNYYWKLDMAAMKAQYMGHISERWPGMLDGGYDAAFTYKNLAYFVKNNWYWEVNTSTSKPLSYKPVIGNVIPRCQKTPNVQELAINETISDSALNPVFHMKKVVGFTILLIILAM